MEAPTGSRASICMAAVDVWEGGNFRSGSWLTGSVRSFEPTRWHSVSRRVDLVPGLVSQEHDSHARTRHSSANSLRRRSIDAQFVRTYFRDDARLPRLELCAHVDSDSRSVGVAPSLASRTVPGKPDGALSRDR